MGARARNLGLAGVFLAAVTAGASPQPAEACMHGISRQVDPVPMGVAEAEQLLDQGKPRAAVARLKSVDPSLINRKPGAGPVSDRALRVFARATARTGGTAPLGYSGEIDGEGADAKRVDWASTMMRDLLKKQPGDAGISTDLGELLALSSTHHEEAERMLTELEGADLLATGHGYAALARIRSADRPGEPGFLKAARNAMDAGRIQIDLARCERMTKDKAACSLSDPSEISAAEPKAPQFAPPAAPKAPSGSFIVRI
jgi:hypothetical protein